MNMLKIKFLDFSMYGSNMLFNIFIFSFFELIAFRKEGNLRLDNRIFFLNLIDLFFEHRNFIY